jgi:uncharacterized protein YbjT (DUF2867 family)
MRIVLLGGTGLVGNHLLAQLINADSNHQILTLGRTKPQIIDESQVTFIETDLAHQDHVSSIISSFQTDGDIDMLICCLGTTIKAAGSRQAFLHVDYDLVVTSAKAARQCGIDRMMLISAINSTPKSKVFYSKVKGQVEETLKTLGFAQLIIIKPSLLMGQRKEFRLAESLFAPIARLINPFLIGDLRKYRGVEGEAVAECMMAQLENPKQGALEVFPTDYL